MQPYAPRTIRFHGIRAAHDWRLKLYSVSHDGSPPDWSVFGTALQRCTQLLPTPAFTPSRPGIGFVIAHHGRTADYLVLAWWDQENELPLRVFVRAPGAAPAGGTAPAAAPGAGPAAGGWRPAQGSESVCVWDLQVIAFERDAYVETFLAQQPQQPRVAWLARHAGEEAPPPPDGNGPAPSSPPKA